MQKAIKKICGIDAICGCHGAKSLFAVRQDAQRFSQVSNAQLLKNRLDMKKRLRRDKRQMPKHLPLAIISEGMSGAGSVAILNEEFFEHGKHQNDEEQQ